MAVDMNTGTVVGGRYRLDRMLGEGGMGMVWAATQKTTEQPVALKFLKGDYGYTTEAVRRRFVREARAAAAVRHPNVVQILDVIELEDGAPVIVMELLLGENLGQLLERQRRLSLAELARVLLPAVSAVGTAHALGIVHRDLKPDNIFLAQEMGHATVKVLDFGIAKLTATEGDAAKTGGLTGTGSMLGTPFYMSPEQAFGEKDVDHRADLWSLGIIFYQCLTGILPTRGENMGQVLKIIVSDGITPLATVAPDLPADITNLVGRMLTRERGKRPQDLREVYNVLRRYADVDAKSFDGAIAPPMSAASSPSGPSLGDSSGPRQVIGPLKDSNPFAKTAASGTDLDDGSPVSDTLLATPRPETPMSAPSTRRSPGDTGTPIEVSIERKHSTTVWLATATLLLGVAVGGSWVWFRAAARVGPSAVPMATATGAITTATAPTASTTASALASTGMAPMPPPTSSASAKPSGHKKPPPPPPSASGKAPPPPPSATGVFIDKPPF